VEESSKRHDTVLGRFGYLEECLGDTGITRKRSRDGCTPTSAIKRLCPEPGPDPGIQKRRSHGTVEALRTRARKRGLHLTHGVPRFTQGNPTNSRLWKVVSDLLTREIQSTKRRVSYFHPPFFSRNGVSFQAICSPRLQYHYV